MQGPPNFLNHDDRRAIRRWRWSAIGIYGCLLAGLIAYIAVGQHRDSGYAAAVAPASINR